MPMTNAFSAVGNFNLKDWATFAGVPAVCYPFGWAVGKAHLDLHWLVLCDMFANFDTSA